MPRFQIAGTKRNTLPAFEAKALEQGGDTGYGKAGRGYLSKVTKAVSEALKEIPDDANLTIAGDISTAGQRLSIQLEIYANHPEIEVVGERYGEPEVSQPAGVGARMNETAGEDTAEVVASNPSPDKGTDVRRTAPDTPVVSGAPASEGPGGTAPSLVTDTSKSVDGATSEPTGRGIGEFTGRTER